jgi:hypothetical protein
MKENSSGSVTPVKNEHSAAQAQQTSCHLTLFVLGGAIHGQRCAGQTEHHDREEACHILSRDTHDTAFGNAPEFRKVRNVGGVKPEHCIQGVMQTDRDEQTIQEAINGCS